MKVMIELSLDLCLSLAIKKDVVVSDFSRRGIVRQLENQGLSAEVRQFRDDYLKELRIKIAEVLGEDSLDEIDKCCKVVTDKLKPEGDLQ